MNYYQWYDKISDYRLTHDVNKKLDRFEGYDDMFTVTTYMTGTFECFAPTDKEVRQAVVARGESLDQILLDEYIAIYRELMVNRIRRATTAPTYYSKSVAAYMGRGGL